MPLPNLFLIGAQKAGSTSIFNWLAQHPDIFAPYYVKDLPFFTSDLYQKGISFYRDLFSPHQAQKWITGCDVNCIYFKDASKRLHQFNPNAKLLFIVRNPVDRAFSSYKYAVQRSLEDLSFEEAIEAELNHERSYNTYYQKAQLDYIGHGFYGAQLKRYLHYFSLDQIFFGVFEELQQDKSGFMNRLFNFLGVEQKVKINFTHQNPTLGGYKFKFINQFLFRENVRENPVITGLLNLIPLVPRYKLRRSLYLKLANFNKRKTNFKPVSAELRNKMVKVYHDDVELLESLTKRRLNDLWFGT